MRLRLGSGQTVGLSSGGLCFLPVFLFLLFARVASNQSDLTHLYIFLAFFPISRNLLLEPTSLKTSSLIQKITEQNWLVPMELRRPQTWIVTSEKFFPALYVRGVYLVTLVLSIPTIRQNCLTYPGY